MGTKSTIKKGKTKKRLSTARTRSRDWTVDFIAALRVNGNILRSCEAAQIGRTTFYEKRREDAAFDQAVKVALEEAGDVLEAEAWRRAVEGVDEPVFGSLGGYQGSGQIGTARKYSDTLLIFLLKGIKPDKFSDRRDIRLIDWKAEAIAKIRTGELLPAVVLEEFGPGLGRELLDAAGVPLPN